MKAEDTLFPSSNWLGIPDLKLELAARAFAMPCWAWGSVARSSKLGGTWHFYVDDRRFHPLLADPLPVVRTGCKAACEPNISVYDDTPMATILAGIYRKRWVARVWQEHDIRILVDVNLPARVLERDEWRLGVPNGWPAFSTRGYDCRVEDLDTEYQAAVRLHGGTDGLLFLVAGGGKMVASWCQGMPGVLHSGYQAAKNVYGKAGVGHE